MKIGILYNLVEEIERGLEIDKLCDNEIIETVECVKKALDREHEAIPVRITRDFLVNLKRESFDFVFNLCEGINGNVKGESLVPAVLDLIGIPYTGSDSLTLGLCLDKIKTKQFLFANNILTPSYQVFYDTEQEFDKKLNFPLIVKPANEDASVGITSDSVVYNETELFKIIEFVLKTYQQPALVEEYIHGRELNVALFESGDSVEILPFSEIVFKVGENQPRVLSYEAKWVAESEMFQKTFGVCPPVEELPKEIEDHIKKLSLDAYNIMGCRDYARVDFRLRGGVPYILEVNPNPAINIERDSGFVRSAQVSGLSYDELIYGILSSAMKRYGLKSYPEKQDKNNGDCEFYETSRLTASKVKLKHLSLLAKWFNDPDLAKYMDAPGENYSVESLTESFLVFNQDDINLIISEKESKRGIGYCSIYDINPLNQSAEISILIGEKEFQGKGYGTKAVELMLDIAFNKLGLNRIFATATRINKPSIKILEQTGFRRVGVMREYHFLDGEKLDEDMFEIIRSDYLKRFI